MVRIPAAPRIMLKSKIHNALVTQVDLKYDGSLTIDENLMLEADIIENERVQVVNVNNGARFETYVIKGDKNSGIMGLNGPAARLGQVGDIIHILAYTIISDEELHNFEPINIILDKNNWVNRKKR